MKECSGDEKTCMKQFYVVGKMSDLFYNLGCSTKASAEAQKETARVSSTLGIFNRNFYQLFCFVSGDWEGVDLLLRY